MTIAANLSEIFECHLGSAKYDSKGREIGYTVGLRDDGSTFYAWVQSARKSKGEWSYFGVPQRSKKFTSQAAATNWAYSTAKERLRKLSV